MANQNNMNLPIATPVVIANEPAAGYASVYEHGRKDSSPIVSTLRRQGYPTNLSIAMTEITASVPLRLWVIDNSGSMNQGDGHKIVDAEEGRKLNIVSCTRWGEMQDVVDYQVQMSALLNAQTIFRLLNDPGERVGRQQFSVAQNGPNWIENEVKVAKATMQRAMPDGWATPLTMHVNEFRNIVARFEHRLNEERKRVVIVLATDGLPTNMHGGGGQFYLTEFIQALKRLEGLPVALLVRLCTDDKEVANFYNSLDQQLGIPIEVLDDFVAEAHKVHQHNRWLNYALPLHRCRELGFQHPVLHLLSSRSLSRKEVRDLCVLMFGEGEIPFLLPDAESDWDGFVNSLKSKLSKEYQQWNPVKRNMVPWISFDKLEEDYAGGVSPRLGRSTQSAFRKMFGGK